MPKKRLKEEVVCEHFRWLVGSRNGVWFADGRSNPTNVGRQSLGTKDRQEAMDLLRNLDRAMAIQFGKISPQSPTTINTATPLLLEAGRAQYMAYVCRPAALGGVRKKSQARYKAVFDKFIAYSKSNAVHVWNEVTDDHLSKYVTWLESEKYQTATFYLEVTTVKQAVKWFIKRGLMPQSSALHLTVKRPRSSSRYCWTQDQVKAMLDHCYSDKSQHWLGNVLLALATTGLRISELAGLRWSDLDFNAERVILHDRTLNPIRGNREDVRSTKSGRSRALPIPEDLRNVLSGLTRYPDGHVFRGACGGKLDPDKVRKALIKHVQEPLASRFPSEPDELGFMDGTPHSFRHYFCSAAATSGVAERVVQDWLGHQASKMIQWYYHLASDESKRQMTKLKSIAGGADAAWRRSIPQNSEGSTPEQKA